MAVKVKIYFKDPQRNLEVYEASYTKVIGNFFGVFLPEEIPKIAKYKYKTLYFCSDVIDKVEQFTTDAGKE